MPSTPRPLVHTYQPGKPALLSPSCPCSCPGLFKESAPKIFQGNLSDSSNLSAQKAPLIWGNDISSWRPMLYRATASFIYIFIFGCVGSSLLRGLFLVAVSRGYSSLQCAGFSLQWLLLLRSTGSRHMGFSSCGTQAQWLWRTGLVAPRHVRSSRNRARTRVPCILNHCATREVPNYSIF